MLLNINQCCGLLAPPKPLLCLVLACCQVADLHAAYLRHLAFVPSLLHFFPSFPGSYQTYSLPALGFSS